MKIFYIVQLMVGMGMNTTLHYLLIGWVVLSHYQSGKSVSAQMDWLNNYKYTLPFL
ncbi:hypothetical protein ECEPECA14_0480 [Escherichia coli EPECa14]|nr:hypothetical protein ECEPECA14_0480 [Escherichia coli EPECa14]EGI88553.1 hypothetical protein SB521682_5202 [Shigella boydii 5216-82]EGI88881.1 hypothetical protein SD15574_5335 [Shigella dysenteriae 155-74]EHW26563.1 hypothetical protein ECDEC8C_0056 [Escherichia coli DEC8C]EHW71922.1 hypothetical protein ECDEC10D_5676 [Escherichia coli DEC10D]EHW80021.1 hypothetical protein ECDEC10B_0059 [Escherichia coli DEC10B]EHW81536.1 hypothetical protein ECDEC10C_0061 [Escherichia coli DEC10C]EIQ2